MTWGTWLVVGLLTFVVPKMLPASGIFRVVGSISYGIAATLVFFLLTNFGVWVIWNNWFAPGLSGLVQAYIDALPFVRTQLVTNALLMPAAIIAGDQIKSRLRYRSFGIAETTPQGLRGQTGH
jgi:hypothetical protein